MGVNEIPSVVNDLLNVQLADIFEVIDFDGPIGNRILLAVESVFGRENTFGRYLGDIDFLDKGIFKVIMGEEVYDFAEGVLSDDRLDYFKGLIGESKIGNIVEVFVSSISETDGVWYSNDERLPYILSDLLDVKFGDIFEVIEKEGEVTYKILAGVDAFSGRERTIGEYLENIEFLKDKKFFEGILDEPFYDFVEGVLADDRIDYIVGLFDDVTIGNVVQIALSDLTENDGVWSLDEELPLIVSDLFNVKLTDIYDYVKEITDGEVKDGIYDAVKGTFKDRTLKDYVTDLVDIDNVGVNKLLDIGITHTVGVALDKESYDGEGLTGIGIVDLILDHTSDIYIGDFINGAVKDGDIWRENGEEVSEILNTIYNIPLSTILMVVGGTIYAILYPDEALDVVGDYRLGYLLGDVYNNVMSEMDSRMSGNNDDGYDIDGSFAAVMEIIMNLTVREIYDNLGNFGSFADEKFMDLKIGDLGYDLMRLYLNDILDLNLGVDGERNVNANSGKYSAGGSFKAILDATFNISLRELTESIKKGEIKELLEERYYQLAIGDFVYDAMRMYFGEAIGYTLSGYAYEGYNVEGTLGLLISDVFGVTIQEIVDIANKDAEVTEKILDLVDAISGRERTFGEYINIDKVHEIKVLKTFLAQTVYHFTEEVLGDNRIEYLKSLFEDVKLGFIGQIFLDLEEGTPWTFNGEDTLLILSDVLDVTVGDILDVVEYDGELTDRILLAVEKIAEKTRKFYDYIEVDEVREIQALEKFLDQTVYHFVDEVMGEDRVEYL